MEGNSNMLNPVVVPPMTIAELNAKLREATAKVLGTSGPSNTVVLVRDMVMPELTIQQQALLDAITPTIAADGNWWIGATNTGINAAGLIKSPDGSTWKLSGVSDDGTTPVFTKILAP